MANNKSQIHIPRTFMPSLWMRDRTLSSSPTVPFSRLSFNVETVVAAIVVITSVMVPLPADNSSFFDKTTPLSLLATYTVATFWKQAPTRFSGKRFLQHIWETSHQNDIAVCTIITRRKKIQFQIIRLKIIFSMQICNQSTTLTQQ